MTLRVVGAGLGRTGTMSLKVALEKLLGAPCYHMAEVFKRPPDFDFWGRAGRGEKVDWRAPFEGFGAAVDWPSGAFWRELSEEYPDALILLSTRSSSEAWWKSASDTIFRVLGDASPVRTMMQSVLENRFTTAIQDREASIAAYEKHNADVRAHAPRHRFLDWKPGDGWEPICKALDLPVPTDPFPHVNTTDEFRARVVSRVPQH